jgi:anti-sigma-K factor RskA
MSDLHSLASEYAVGSLSASETAEFESHLATCDECRREVAEMQDVAVQLSEAVATEPPATLRSSVLAQIAQTPQVGSTSAIPSAATAAAPSGPPARTSSNVIPMRRWPNATWATGLFAAAALAAAVALGGWAIHSRDDASAAAARTEQLTRLLGAPDVRTATGSFASSGSGTVIVSATQRKALLVTADLPALPSGQVYEAWTMSPTPVPAGTFSAGGSPALVNLPVATVKASAVAVTVEPDGGSDQPTTDPIFTVRVPKA